VVRFAGVYRGLRNAAWSGGAGPGGGDLRGISVDMGAGSGETPEAVLHWEILVSHAGMGVHTEVGGCSSNDKPVRGAGRVPCARGPSGAQSARRGGESPSMAFRTGGEKAAPRPTPGPAQPGEGCLIGGLET